MDVSIFFLSILRSPSYLWNSANAGHIAANVGHKISVCKINKWLKKMLRA